MEQTPVNGKQLLNGWIDLLALRCQPDAAVVAQEEGKANLLLQGVHHMGQARLAVAQLLGGLCKAAQLHRHSQRFQFPQIHTAAPPLSRR